MADNAFYGVLIDVGALGHGDKRFAAVVCMMPWVKGKAVNDSIRTYEDGKKKRTDFDVKLEAFDPRGIRRDFELLKKAGVIKSVEIKQETIYFVY